MTHSCHLGSLRLLERPISPTMSAIAPSLHRSMALRNLYQRGDGPYRPPYFIVHFVLYYNFFIFIVLCVAAIRHTPRSRITFIRQLGEGAFAKVYLGVCEGLGVEGRGGANEGDSDTTMVAIKTLKVGLAR